jgi:hypothetical protein
MKKSIYFILTVISLGLSNLLLSQAETVEPLPKETTVRKVSNKPIDQDRWVRMGEALRVMEQE